MITIRRYVISLLFASVSVVPFNFLQFIVLSVNSRQFPFYYAVIGIPVLILVLWTMIKIDVTSYKGIFVMFGILYAGMITSVINAVDIFWVVRSILSFSLRGPLLVIAMLPLYNDIKNIKKTMYFMVIIGLIVALIGICEFFANKNPFYHDLYLKYNVYYHQTLDMNWRGGMCSTIGHPLPMSAFLVLLVPLSFVWHHSSSTKGYNLYSICLFTIISVGIYLSFSRSSLICLFLILILYNLRKPRRLVLRNFKTFVAFFLVITLSLILINVLSSKARMVFQKRMSIPTFSIEVFNSHRASSYKTTFNILKQYTLWGVGFGNYPKVHKKFLAENANLEINTPDNQYLRWLADTGIVGFGCLAAFFILFFKKFAKAYRKCPDEGLKTLMWAMFCGIVGFMVNLMTFDGFFWLAPNFAFWMMIGLLAATMRLSEEQYIQ